jgi:hypothetical protein
MAEDTAQASGGGIGFAGLLTILFIGLKLTGYITWSWLWVLFPLWGGLAISALFFIGFIIIAAIVSNR